jgi:rubrerythrin
MPTSSLDDCFKRAIESEHILRKCYIRMAGDFSYDDVLRVFFLDLAADEGEHAKALNQAQKGEPKSDHLEGLAKEILAKLDKLQAQLDRLFLKDYLNFEEAFTLAHDLEKTEINNIFFMLNSGAVGVDEKKSAKLHTAMNIHLQKLVDLGNQYKGRNIADILPRR